jgi:hypothetical protein
MRNRHSTAAPLTYQTKDLVLKTRGAKKGNEVFLRNKPTKFLVFSMSIQFSGGNLFLL